MRFRPAPLAVGDRVQYATKEHELPLFGRVSAVYDGRYRIEWEDGSWSVVASQLVFAAPDEDEIARLGRELFAEHCERRQMDYRPEAERR